MSLVQKLEVTEKNFAVLMAPQDDNAMLIPRMEDSSLRQLWRLTNMLVKVRYGAHTKRC